MGFRFLDLPPELRDQIYHEVLSSENARHPPPTDDHPATYHFDLSLLLANRRIHHEALRAFRDSNIFVKITTPWEESIAHINSEGRVPIIVTGGRADAFRLFHLLVAIDAPVVPCRDSGYSMVICLADLPAFTRMWNFSNLSLRGLNGHLRLRLTLNDPHNPDRKIPKELQTRLLQPFGLVKDLYGFSLHGTKVLPSVEDALKRELATPDPSPEECLEKADALRETGDKHFHAKEYTAALEKYTASFAAIHITVSGRQRYIHADAYYARGATSGPYNNQLCSHARLLLRVKLVAGTIRTYLRLREWDEAWFWGKRSILLWRAGMIGDEDPDLAEERKWQWLRHPAHTSFPAGTDMGWIFYWTSLAARELGLEAEARNLGKAALIYVPHHEIMREEKSMPDGQIT
ncbi:MAG: hypothetical protein Q9219_002485 [cf. Caloplaca sp. 3 TL-2023]